MAELIPIDRKTEGKLITKASRGDEKAFEYLMSLNSAKLRTFIQKRRSQNTDCEECFQVTQFKAWKNLKKFKKNSSFFTWTCRIAINLIIDEYRKSSVRNRMIPICEGERTSEGAAFDLAALKNGLFHENEGVKKLNEEETKLALETCLSKISLDHRKVLELYFFEGMKYEEIAKKLKISVGTVMSRIFYAKKHLKKVFHCQFKEEEFS